MVEFLELFGWSFFGALGAFVVAFVMSEIYHNLFWKRHNETGTLYYDDSNPDKIKFNLVVDGDLDAVPKKKYVIFKVSRDSVSKKEQ